MEWKREKEEEEQKRVRYSERVMRRGENGKRTKRDEMAQPREARKTKMAGWRRVARGERGKGDGLGWGGRPMVWNRV